MTITPTVCEGRASSPFQAISTKLKSFSVSKLNFSLSTSPWFYTVHISNSGGLKWRLILVLDLVQYMWSPHPQWKRVLHETFSKCSRMMWEQECLMRIQEIKDEECDDTTHLIKVLGFTHDRYISSSTTSCLCELYIRVYGQLSCSCMWQHS